MNVKLIRDLYHKNISEESCCALIWYLRNSIFFDFQLIDHPQVMLLHYERLVKNPEKEMRHLLNFINLGFSKAVLFGISPKNIGKESPPKIDEKIKALCDGMYQKLTTSL